MADVNGVMAMSDEDFMAELLGVRPKEVADRTVDVDAQLRMQLASIHNQRTIVHDYRGVPSEHFSTGSRPKVSR